MKTYIIICCFADRIAGGPIYYSNKVKYMEEQGWKVVVIPADTGQQSAVPGLAKFFGPWVPNIGYMPSEFTPRQREHIMSQLLSFVPNESDNIVVETGNDYTAYWGELLAERIHAKHIVIFIDEQNPNITKEVIDFYKFKYDRDELACISKPVMQNLFKPFFPLSLEQCKSLSCVCHNSIDDYEHTFTSKIVTSKYNIGYIGRLDKPFFPAIIEGIQQFCKKHDKESITITLFGGAPEQKTTDNIQSIFQNYKNVKLLISGYLYPLPIQALKKMDVFVAGAGSAFTATKSGVTCIDIDILKYKPIGIIVNTPSIHHIECPNASTLLDYLEWVLVDKTNLPKPNKVDYMNDWNDVCNAFSQHIEFFKKSNPQQKYYQVVNMITPKGRKKRILRSFLGVKGYEILHNFILWMNKKIIVSIR